MITLDEAINILLDELTGKEVDAETLIKAKKLGIKALEILKGIKEEMNNNIYKEN